MDVERSDEGPPEPGLGQTSADRRASLISAVKTLRQLYALIVLVWSPPFGYAVYKNNDTALFVLAGLFLVLVCVPTVTLYLRLKLSQPSLVAHSLPGSSQPPTLPPNAPSNLPSWPPSPSVSPSSPSLPAANTTPEFQRFWAVLFDGASQAKPPKPVTTVFSAKYPSEHVNGKPVGKASHTVYLSFNEVLEIYKLRSLLGSVWPSVRLEIDHTHIRHPDTGEEHGRDPHSGGHLVLVGSTHANRSCRRVFSQAPLRDLPYQFRAEGDDKCIVKGIPSPDGWVPDLSRPSLRGTKDGDTVEEDFGMIVRTSNPFDRDGKVLIVGANHGFGTQSGLAFLSDPHQIGQLESLVGSHDFQAIYHAWVLTTEHAGSKLELCEVHVLESDGWRIAWPRAARSRLLQPGVGANAG